MTVLVSCTSVRTIIVRHFSVNVPGASVLGWREGSLTSIKSDVPASAKMIWEGTLRSFCKQLIIRHDIPHSRFMFPAYTHYCVRYNFNKMNGAVRNLWATETIISTVVVYNELNLGIHRPMQRGKNAYCRSKREALFVWKYSEQFINTKADTATTNGQYPNGILRNA